MKFVEVTYEEFLEDRRNALLSGDLEAVKVYGDKYNVNYGGMSDVAIMRGAQKAVEELTGKGGATKKERDLAWLKYSNWLLKHGYTRGQDRRMKDEEAEADDSGRAAGDAEG